MTRDELRAIVECTRIDLINDLRTLMHRIVDDSCNAIRDNDEFEIDDVRDFIAMYERVDDNAHDITSIVSQYESLTFTYNDAHVDVQQQRVLRIMRELNDMKRDDNRDDIDTICNALCDVFDL